MKPADKEAQDLIAALKKQYDSVRERQEFLKLKESELRPGDQISFYGFMEAKQNLAMEQSLFSAHVLMIQEDIQKRRIILDSQNQKYLVDFITYSRRLQLS